MKEKILTWDYSCGLGLGIRWGHRGGHGRFSRNWETGQGEGSPGLQKEQKWVELGLVILTGLRYRIFVSLLCCLLSVMKNSVSMDSSDQKKTRIKLKKFLTRRPTYQAVRDKGYIKGDPSGSFSGSQCVPCVIAGLGQDLVCFSHQLVFLFTDQVFGCSLTSLCQRENTSVPNFVTMCIDHVEDTGKNYRPCFQLRTVHCPLQVD